MVAHDQVKLAEATAEVFPDQAESISLQEFERALLGAAADDGASRARAPAIP